MKTTVVVEGGPPKHCAMCHHAARDVFRLQVVTRATTASPGGNTQVARIDETNKLPALTRQQRIRAFRISAAVLAIASPLTRKQRSHMGQLFHSLNVFRIAAGLSGHR